MGLVVSHVRNTKFICSILFYILFYYYYLILHIYHAYREWQGWSVEYDENENDDFPVNYTTARKAELLSWYSKNIYPYPHSQLFITLC
jgi:hypothetical protein